MFLEFDSYFVNLAKVDNISVASEVPGDDEWDLFIYMDSEGSEPIPLRSGFVGLNHAEAFKRAVIRHACTTGLCTGDDMDQLFRSTMPGPTDN